MVGTGKARTMQAVGSNGPAAASEKQLFCPHSAGHGVGGFTAFGNKTVFYSRGMSRGDARPLSSQCGQGELHGVQRVGQCADGAESQVGCYLASTAQRSWLADRQARETEKSVC